MSQSSLRYNHGQQVDDGYAAAHTALAIDPTIAEAHLPMVKRLLNRGQLDAAAAELAKAINLGADSWEVNKEAGRYFLFSQRDIATATKHYEAATEIQDSDFHGWGMLAVCYHAAGDEKKLRNAGKMMVSEAQRAVQQDPSNGAALGILAGGYALLGEREKAHEWIQRALLIDPDNVNMRYNFACILAGYLRDTEAALSLLQSTLSMAGQDQIRIAEADPDLDPIRDDPRFQKLLADAKDRLGIVDAAAAI